MRVAGLTLAALLALSPSDFAQHSSSSGSSSASHSSSSSSSHSSPSAGSASHSSPAASRTSSATAPSHTASSGKAPVSSVAKSAPKESAPKDAAPKSTETSEVTKRDLPANPKLAIEKAEPKDKADLRHPVLCGGKPCVTTGTGQTAQHHHIWPFLRHRNCLNQPCTVCPNGKAAGKNGCGGSTVAAVTPHACPGGETWNGAVCSHTAAQCHAGQVWNGASCQADCTTATGSSGNLTLGVRSARQRRDDVCRQNPQSQECQEAESSYNLELERYRSFLAGVPANCRTTLPDPISL